MLLIIPWRGWARAASGAALLDRREPPIFRYLANSAAGRSMALVLLAATGSTASSAPAAIERAGGLSVVLSLRHFGWRDAAHYPLAGVERRRIWRGAARPARAADFRDI